LTIRIVWRPGLWPLLNAVLGASLILSSIPTVRAQSDPFDTDKTVRIIVGSTPGGFYDRWARLLSRYIPQYVPGNPSFVVQNMPGVPPTTFTTSPRVTG
jgi:tripartite-type tricarboxylate transporter receptor subunit TctC